MRKNSNLVIMELSSAGCLALFGFTNNQGLLVGLIYLLLVSLQVLVYLNSRAKNRWLFALSALFLVEMIGYILTSSDLSLLVLCSLTLSIGYLPTVLSYNPFIGIRIFSTRYSGENWQATHALLAFLSLPVSCLIIPLSYVMTSKNLIVLTYSLWIVIPLIYSIKRHRTS